MKKNALNQTIRPARQAGRFYDASPQRLLDQIQTFLAESPAPALEREAAALLVPHAGYIYSGRVAAAAIRAIQGMPISHVLILAPSHFGSFAGAALPPQAAFATPLGEVDVDQQGAAELADEPNFLIEDSAHAAEHSIEVQLPLLQVALPAGFQILPVALGRTPAEGLEPLAITLAGLVEERRRRGQRWLILASSDTYHGENPAACRENDELLMELIQSMDVQGLIDGIESGRVMACGWQALALTMSLARLAGARRGQIMRRDDSQGATGQAGDYIVGYIGAAFV